MDNNTLKSLLIFYFGVSGGDLAAKLIILNQIYFKALKEAPKLKYTDDLSLESKKNLLDIKLMHAQVLFGILYLSFIPGVGFCTTKNILDRKEDFKDAYDMLIKSSYDEINEIEEYDREGCAIFLKELHDSEEFREAIGDEYKGHKFEDATIRISRKEMIKFLKKKRIVLEEMGTDGEYTDYYVKLLDK